MEKYMSELSWLEDYLLDCSWIGVWQRLSGSHTRTVTFGFYDFIEIGTADFDTLIVDNLLL